MHLSTLTVGDLVRRGDGTYGIVEVVLIIDEPQVMYNLSVSHVATYLAGEGRWVVHNEDLITIFRFADRALLETLEPGITRATGLTALMGKLMYHINPPSIQFPNGKYRDWLVAMHAQGSLGDANPISYYVSATTDIDRALGTDDPTLAKIMTGYEDPFAVRLTVQRAPDIGTFAVPESRLLYPDHASSIIEKEVLFKGRGLIDYWVGWQTNPYTPKDLTYPKFCER